MNGFDASLLVPLPVVVPLLAAALTLVLARHPTAQRTVSIGALIGVVAVAAVLLVQADRHGPQTVWIGAWPEPLGIALVADRLSSLMLLVSAIVTLAVLVYSVGQGMTDDAESAPLSIYHPSFLVLVGGVANAFLAADLFNLFVSFEMLLFASYVLLTLGGTESRIRAGTIYVVVNVVSSTLFLIAIATVYAATGSLNLAQLAGRLADLPDPVSLMIQLLLLTTFCIKAAVFPLSFWLPDSYPTAPAPVTAVFAGLLTKVGVYAVLRTQSLLFPDSPLSNLLLVAALLTMLVGILGAVAQADIKRMLSFTLVSHIGYMILGVALANEAGFAGAIFYVVHHITIQTVLFLVLGLVEHRAGSTSLLRLGGVARLSPVLGITFFVAAMNLAGIPPMSGFLGKVGLTSAAIEVGTPLTYTLAGAGMVTSLLTLYAVAKAWNLAFWRTPEQAHDTARAVQDEDDRAEEVVAAGGDQRSWGRRSADPERRRVQVGPASYGRDEVTEARSILDEGGSRDLHQRLIAGDLPTRNPRSMLGATVGLVAVSLTLTLVAGPLFGYADRASEDLLDREPYISSVLPEELR
jgi:multicomponent Na+:H+ antiporter subunit D